MIQTEMNNFELSEELFENSIRLNKDIESKLNEAESSIELGNLFIKTERADKAKPYLESANNFLREIYNEKLTAGLVHQSI
jgi:hypothetical protein